MGIEGFVLFLWIRIGRGAKDLKQGKPSGGEVINGTLSIMRVIIVIGCVLVGILFLVFLLSGKNSLFQSFTLLLSLIPLYITHRYMTGITHAVNMAAADIGHWSSQTYHNPVRLSLMAYVLSGLSVFFALIFSILSSDSLYRPQDLIFYECYILLVILSAVPLYLTGKCNNLIQYAHHPDASIEDMKRRANGHRHSGTAILGSAFAICMFVRVLSSVISMYISTSRFLYYPEQIGALQMIFDIITPLPYLLFAIGFLVRKRGTLFGAASCIMLAINLFGIYSSLSTPLFYYAYTPAYMMILEYSSRGLWIVFSLMLVFFSFSTSTGKRRIPSFVRAILIALPIILFLLNLILNLGRFDEYPVYTFLLNLPRLLVSHLMYIFISLSIGKDA